MASARRFLAPPFIIGMGVMTLGVLFLLDNLGYRAAGTVLNYWPVILIAVGAAKLVSARSVPAAIGGTLWALVGAWILSDKLEVLQPAFATILRIGWPLILLALGFIIVRHALSG